MVQTYTFSLYEGGKMKVKTILRGGLGNQMFQYATARSLTERYKGEVVLGIGSYNDQNRKYPYPLSITNYNISVVKDDMEWRTNKIINEPHYHYTSIFENLDLEKMDVIISGYWQCEKYFKDIRDILIGEFTPKIISQRVKDYLDKISQYDTSYIIAVHIRRGERVYEEDAKKTHGLIHWSYYQETFRLMKDSLTDDKLLFVIFSDDIDYARKNYNLFPGKVIYIEPGLDYEDLFLFSQCNHAIVANSSFSWWGAWLIQNKTKIIMSPDQWVKNPQIITKDVIPKEWIQIYTKLI
jgi:hypothetical protein